MKANTAVSINHYLAKLFIFFYAHACFNFKVFTTKTPTCIFLQHEDASNGMLDHILENTDGLKDMMEKCGLEIKKEKEDGDDLKFIKEMIKGKKNMDQVLDSCVN